MAEAFEQFKQFEYKNNSNLVLQRESGSVHDGPTGEPESLLGRLPGKMGDKRMVARLPKELLSSISPYVQVDGVKIRTELSTTRRKKRRLDSILERLNLTSVTATSAGDEPVAVVFESGSEEDDEDDDTANSVSEHDDQDLETFNAGTFQGLENDEDRHTLATAAGLASGGVKLLSVSDITPHWLQGELTDRGIVSPADISLHLLPTEEEILKRLILPDLQECESALVDIIGVDHFDFIALLLHNRWRVYYLTKLQQAQTPADRQAIEDSMKETAAGRQVLSALLESKRMQNKEKAFEESMKAEAAELNRQNADELPTNQQKDEIMESSKITPSADILNLDQLSFKVEDRLLGYDEVKLPKGTERISAKDWEEVIIPEKTRTIQADDTIDVDKVLPKWALPSFVDAGIRRLNPIQTKVAPTAFGKRDVNVLVCAPTGAGKTNIAMLAILEVVSRYIKPTGVDTVGCALNQFKIVYVSPMKALVAEQVSAFRKRLDALNLGIKVNELTGDINLSQAEIEETQIIVTTPEKWDVITRKSGERSYTQLVRLMIFDEIHLLHDKRGAVVETLIARALRQYESTGQQIRFMGLSATLPNPEDVAIFLRVPKDDGLFVFGGEFRPVPLRQCFIGIKTKSSSKRYELMNQVCYDKLIQFAGHHQVLIFCHSRKETSRTAKYLRDRAFQSGEITKLFSQGDGDISKQILLSEKEKVVSPHLKDLLPFGFAIHHAGMQRSDRKLVEDLFADKHIQVLVSTATLAWGVNLPAHAVIIKGTQIYSPELGQWTELPPLDVIQMIGRAGRPPFDKFGEGFIITQQSQLQYYVSLTNQQLPIESQLVSQLPELLNSEIALGTVRTRDEAADWLLYTYLFVRMRRKPSLYHIPEHLISDLALTQWRVDLAHAALLKLDSLRLINYEKASGRFSATALCKAASAYYLRPATISVLNQNLHSELNDVDLLRLFGNVQEFSNVPVRPEEKPELLKCIDKVPIPVKGQIQEPATKINILLQAYISGLKLDGFALQADMGLVVQNAARIMRAIFDITLRRGWAKVAELALSYSKVVDRRMWRSMSPLRQFGVLSLADLKRIEARDIPWNAYFSMTEGELGELVKSEQLGKRIWKLLRQFPRLEVECYILPVTDSTIQIDMTVRTDFEWNKRISRHSEMFWIFVENVDRTKILYVDTCIIKRTEADQDHQLTFTVPLDTPRSPNYFVYVVSDRWLGSERLFPISFKDLIIPTKNALPTNYLGLQPIPITAINFPEALEMLYDPSKYLTSLESQIFQSLYYTNSNVLVCSSASSYELLQELCILRMFTEQSETRPLCVFLSYNDLSCKYTHKRIQSRFGKLNVGEINIMTGNMSNDYKLLSQSTIVVCRYDHWECLSRRWKNKKAVQRVQLVIVDSIDMIFDNEVGSYLEVCISRLRLMSDLLSQQSPKYKPVRIVCFGPSIGNATDLADWLGAEDNVFNFHPTVRTNPLDLTITRIDIPDRNRRLVATYSHIAHAIKSFQGGRPASKANIIIVATERREARQTCIELLLSAAAENNAKKYLRDWDQEVVKDYINSSQSKLREKILKDILAFGVGLVHDGMLEEERHLVYDLFRSGMIQIIVMTHKLIFEVHERAAMVIVQDTEIWDTSKKRWTKYSSDILTRFLALAESEDGSSSSALILCKPARHEEIKRSIFEPIQVESNVDLNLTDHILSEIVSGTISSKQDCVDWFTWTFACRRLMKNPNFYGLRSANETLISEHISEVMENACESLQKSGCVIIGPDELSLEATNLGIIAVFYALKAATVETFSKLVTRASGLRQILTTITASKEVETQMQIRQGEDAVIKMLWEECSGGDVPMPGSPDQPAVKALVLLLAHLNRRPLTPDLQQDLDQLLLLAEKSCHAMVDVLSSTNRLRQLLSAGELCQMITQGLVNNESLLQLPYFTSQTVTLAKEKYNINSCLDIISAEDELRDQLFKEMDLNEDQVEEIARVCNALPVISLDNIAWSKDQVTLDILRDIDAEEVVPVSSAYFPAEKPEQWWIVVASEDGKELLGLKKTSLTMSKNSITISLDPEKDQAAHALKIFCVSDSYVGCDREITFER